MRYLAIEDLIGNTPLVQLQRLPGEDARRRNNIILGKMEGNNPAGSVKDRPAMSMIRHAEERGDIKPGDALPSVRQIAAEYQLNPITVSRAFQELADEQVVEKRRGLGMYMSENAKDRLLASEKQRFLHDEWPAIAERIKRLGLDTAKLLQTTKGESA